MASLVLYVGFVFTQTVRHRDFFLPVSSDEHGRVTGLLDADGDDHADPPSQREAATSLALLVVALVSVVGLWPSCSRRPSRTASRGWERRTPWSASCRAARPRPGGVAAVRHAARDRVQTSLDLAHGSAMASIGLTVPTIAVVSIWWDGPLELGLGITQIVLLMITVVVSVMTVVQGRRRRSRDWCTSC